MTTLPRSTTWRKVWWVLTTRFAQVRREGRLLVDAARLCDSASLVDSLLSSLGREVAAALSALAFGLTQAALR